MLKVLLFIQQKYVFLGLYVALACFAMSPAYANKSGAAPQVLSLPSGPGSLGGIGENVQPNLNMGLMSYQVKILVPQGRGAATPNPSVTYSSSAGAGLMGIGWDFSAGSSVMRGTVRGLPTYTNADIFFAGGELVKIPGSPFYRSRYEGAFMRHRWVQKDASDQRGYWIVESPDGSKMYYGANAKGELNLDAQVYGLKGTYSWKLVTMVDRNGNRVEYSYFKDGSQSYMDQIAWVFDKSDKPLYQLKFNYEERPDHISDGKPGFDLKTTKRIKEVRITSDGTRFRSYSFAYEDATGLSRLIKVTRYGRDATKAYPVEFTMKYSDAVFSQENSKMVTMPTSLGVDFRSGNIDFIDINGDGLPDVIDTSKPKHVFFINQVTLKDDIKQDGHDFPKGLIKENIKETSAQLFNSGIQMIDYNGDGFTDMVDAANKKIYINKGNSKWEDSSASLQSFPVTGKDPNMRFMDYNGDKKIDVISSDGATTTFWVSDGKGSWVVTPGKTNIGLSFDKDRLRLIDINGDGLQDVVHITKNSLRYRKYLGYGEWTEWIDVKVPGIDQYELSTQAQFDDINGDGMADMVAFLGNSIVYFVNKNGEEFEAGKKLETFKGIDIPDSSKMTIRIVDINGNGSRDIVWIDSSGRVTYLELFGKRPNLMESISNGIGQRINVEYGSSVNFYLRDQTCKVGTDKACEGPWQNKMPMAFTVVTKISTWASRSEKPLDQAAPTKEERPMVQAIYYHNGFYDGVEKTFRGFRKVESINVGDDSIEDKKSTIEFDVGDSDPYMHGRTLRQSFSNNQGHTYSLEVFQWQDCPLTGVPKDLDPPVRFICRVSSESTFIEGLKDTSKWKKTRAEQTYDGFGNVVFTKHWGLVDDKGDEQTIKRTFITPKDPLSESSIWILRKVLKKEICNDTVSHCAEVMFYYDGDDFKGLPEGELTRGNLTVVQMRKEKGKSDLVAAMRFKFNAQGNIVGMLSPRGLLREISWDPVYNMFSISEKIHTKNLVLEYRTDWSYEYSRVIRSTDPNGQVTSYTYDYFGRPISFFLPGDSKDKPSIQYDYQLAAPISRVIKSRRSQRDGTFDLKEVQCFDGLGRNLAQSIRFSDGRFLVLSHQDFNARGHVFRRWQSYISSKDCQFLPPSDILYKQSSFDGMGRPTQYKDEVGHLSRLVYSPLSKAVYDPEDNRQSSPHYDTPTLYRMDGLGRLREMEQTIQKGQTLLTQYVYQNVNVKGEQQLAQVIFPNGRMKTQEYDLLGRIIKLEDPDRSSTTYVYDDENNLISRQESDGNEVQSTYDLLNRTLTIQSKGDDSSKISYAYDLPDKAFPTATRLKGNLVQISYPGGSYRFSYDARYNMSQFVHELNGHTYSFTKSYDNVDRLVKESFPDGRSLTYEWDHLGRLKSVPGFIKQVSYLPNSMLESWTGANGVSTRFEYTKRLRPQSLAVAAGKVMRLEYTWDTIGNIEKIHHTYDRQEFTNSYEYDGIYRLIKASLGDNKEVISYQYDALHNLTSRTSSLAQKSGVQVGTFTYHKEKMHALMSVGEQKLSYDRVGCTQSDGNIKYQWDFLRRTTEMRSGDKVIARHWYGHTSHRVVKQEQGQHTLYIAPNYEIRDGNAVIYILKKNDRLISWSAPVSAKGPFLDLAPTKGTQSLTSDPDGQLTAADAWISLAANNKWINLTVPTRPLPLDHTKDILQASLSRLLQSAPTSTDTHYYHLDHLGSVRAVTDSSGAVLLRKDYYPYGTAKHTPNQAFPYGFMGTEKDQATQLNYFGSRFLDTRLSRWQSPDPLFATISNPLDEFNSYGLTKANPIRYRDINGTESVSAEQAIGFVFAASMIVYTIGRAVFAEATKISADAKSNAKGHFSNDAWDRNLERPKAESNMSRVKTVSFLTGATRVLIGTFLAAAPVADAPQGFTSVAAASAVIVSMIGTVNGLFQKSNKQEIHKGAPEHELKIRKNARKAFHAGNLSGLVGTVVGAAAVIGADTGAFSDGLSLGLKVTGMVIGIVSVALKEGAGAYKNKRLKDSILGRFKKTPKAAK